jgi:hypothetical protein
MEDTSPAADLAAKTNSYLTEYIKFADLKAGSILAIVTALGAATALTATKALTSASMIPLCLLWTVGGVLVIAATGTVWHTVNALSPRTATAAESLHSFPDIAQLELASYSDRVKALNDSTVVDQYLKHNHALARIATSKFTHIAAALSCLRVATIALFGVTLIYSYITAAQPKKIDTQASCTAKTTDQRHGSE